MGCAAKAESDTDDVDCVACVYLVVQTDVEPIFRLDSMSKDVKFTLMAMVYSTV